MNDRALDWFYNKTLHGLPGWSAVPEFVQRRQTDCPHQSSLRLSRWHSSRAGALGFVSGLGGLATLPVSFSVGIFSELYLQARLSACIAHVYGHDIDDDQTKALVFACLGLVTDTPPESGGARNLTAAHFKSKAMQEVFSEVAVRSNQWVLTRVGSAVGSKSLGHVSRVIPLVGSVATAGTGAYSIYKTGKKAQQRFSAG